jgi:hypothetical protein
MKAAAWRIAAVYDCLYEKAPAFCARWHCRLKTRAQVMGTRIALCWVKSVKSTTRKTTMGRFARDSRREVVDRNGVKMTAHPQFAGEARFKQGQRQTWEDRNKTNYRAPIELKYFVLALAALVGLGVGWLSGKAITGWLPSTTSPPAVVDRDATPMSEDAGERLQAAQAAFSPEVATPQEAVADAAASPESDASAETMAQAAADDSQTRAERKVARHGHMRRQARGNFFFKPFKALRKLRIW